MTRRRRATLGLVAAGLLALAAGLTLSTLDAVEPAGADGDAAPAGAGGDATPAGAGGDAAPAGAGGEATPLWSVRRVPALVAEIASLGPLRAELAAVLAGHEACATVADDGAVAIHAGTDTALTPASTTKLLTGAAALGVLGPDHRFVTRVVAGAAVVDGVLASDLVLVGGGDPGLSTPEFRALVDGTPRRRDDPRTALDALADAVVAAGVRRIEGSVLGDDRRHDDLRFLDVWRPSYREQGQSGPLGALVVDDGFDPIGTRAAVADPAVHAAAALTRLLRDRGVEVVGDPGRGGAPEGAGTLATVESAPLADVVAGLITSSDNLAAELVLREVGVAAGSDGTTAGGARAALDVLADLDVPVEGVRILDGSGLARDAAVPCGTVLAAVELGRRPGFEALEDGLAVAGRTGTLAARFGGDPLAGRLRAKTGQLSGVVGLAGVIDGDRGLRFAFLARGPFDVAGGHALQAAVARAVDGYPAVGSDVVPPPSPAP